MKMAIFLLFSYCRYVINIFNSGWKEHIKFIYLFLSHLCKQASDISYGLYVTII